MDFRIKPVVGEWYQAPEGEDFEVVAIDPDERTVEIQYFDGAIEELDYSSWAQLQLQPIQPPEDWSGSVDMMREDFMTDIGMSTQEDWADPLDVIDSLAADEY
jgi:hypothetical protein